MATEDRAGIGERLKRSLGPLMGGILLDVLDFATLGPFGLTFGWLVGGLVAWWIGSLYGFSRGQKFLLATLAAVYCTIPMTEFIPLATILSATCRLFETPEKTKPPAERKQVESKIVEPDDEK